MDRVIEWFLEQWERHSLYIIFTLLILVMGWLINLYRNRVQLEIEAGESKTKEGGEEYITQISYSAQNVGRSPCMIEGFYIEYENGDERMPFVVGGYPLRGFGDRTPGLYFNTKKAKKDLYEAIQNRQYRIFVKTASGDRYYSNSEYKNKNKYPWHSG